ncbi:hypothetical protein C1H46_004062 [Malus baccata]|uniref:UDP-glycosyltransferases domain-containing protein n=1 Tax=Malus baccata TaxID=106549 RepID=A0A540NIK4_MALBA|nr:hypothetical protein C1H46_004062 [Malus baccata]
MPTRISACGCDWKTPTHISARGCDRKRQLAFLHVGLIGKRQLAFLHVGVIGNRQLAFLHVGVIGNRQLAFLHETATRLSARGSDWKTPTRISARGCDRKRQPAFLHVGLIGKRQLAFLHVGVIGKRQLAFLHVGHQISFISTPQNINRLRSSSLSLLIDFVELPLPAIDGLPESVESTSQLPINKVPYLKKAYDLLKPAVTHFVQHSGVNWVVHDVICYWLPQVATQLGVNSVFFSIINATSLAFDGPPSELLDNKRRWPDRRTLRSFPSGSTILPPSLISCTRCCTEVESDAMSLLRNLYGKLVVLLGLLPTSSEPHQPGGANDGTNEKWEVLKEWLENKKPNSVVYIALGTEVTLSQELMHELAHGIEKSGCPLFGWSTIAHQGLNARLMHEKQVGLEISRDERDGSFTSDSVAELIRRVMVEKEGELVRANAWAMKEIFGNVELNKKCLDEFTRVLETWPAST